MDLQFVWINDSISNDHTETHFVLHIFPVFLRLPFHDCERITIMRTALPYIGPNAAQRACAQR
jgi:hypothetical protein